MKQQYYYNLGADKVLVIFNSEGHSVAHVSDVEEYEPMYFVVSDTLYNMGLIGMTEDIDLTRI